MTHCLAIVFDSGIGMNILTDKDDWAASENINSHFYSRVHIKTRMRNFFVDVDENYWSF